MWVGRGRQPSAAAAAHALERRGAQAGEIIGGGHPAGLAASKQAAKPIPLQRPACAWLWLCGCACLPALPALTSPPPNGRPWDAPVVRRTHGFASSCRAYTTYSGLRSVCDSKHFFLCCLGTLLITVLFERQASWSDDLELF